MKYCSISEVSAKFNIPESTLRYYEKKGLLPLIERDEAGRRLFSENQMTLLEIIIYLKNTHMPVKGIQQYVNWVVEGDSTTERRLEMMKNHKHAVLAEISLSHDCINLYYGDESDQIENMVRRFIDLTDHQMAESLIAARHGLAEGFLKEVLFFVLSFEVLTALCCSSKSEELHSVAPKSVSRNAIAIHFAHGPLREESRPKNNFIDQCFAGGISSSENHLWEKTH